MTLFALVLALVLEQIRPFAQRAAVDELLSRLCHRAAELYDDGSYANGRLAWLLLVVGAGLAAWLLHLLLHAVHPLLAFAFSAGTLYLILGFRRDERLFTDVQRALADDDATEAARRLGAWDGQDHAGAAGAEVARLAVEHAILRAHRGVFGVVFWFVLLPGPVGAVMYRLAREMHDRAGCADGFGAFACRAWELADYLPARLTAVAFSVIGNFEDALYCWRTQAALWPERAAGVLLAAGAGALGLRLGMPVHRAGAVVDRPELGLGATVDVEQMPRAARMMWRVMVLYVLLLTLLAIAGWVGR